MRKIFLDCGANDGCSVRKFINENEDYKDYFVHSFEPNPSLHKSFDDIKAIYKEKFKLHKLGVSNKNSEITFYRNPNYSSAGTFDNVKGNKKNCGSKVHCDNVEKLSIKCLDLSSWISENFSKEDYIVLKLDIEGSEYDVVPKMIEDETFSFINKFYIEWHDKWCGKPNGTSKSYIKKIKNKFSIDSIFWDAQEYQTKKQY